MGVPGRALIPLLAETHSFLSSDEPLAACQIGDDGRLEKAQVHFRGTLGERRVSQDDDDLYRLFSLYGHEERGIASLLG